MRYTSAPASCIAIDQQLRCALVSSPSHLPQPLIIFGWATELSCKNTMPS